MVISISRIKASKNMTANNTTPMLSVRVCSCVFWSKVICGSYAASHRSRLISNNQKWTFCMKWTISGNATKQICTLSFINIRLTSQNNGRMTRKSQKNSFNAKGTETIVENEYHMKLFQSLRLSKLRINHHEVSWESCNQQKSNNSDWRTTFYLLSYSSNAWVLPTEQTSFYGLILFKTNAEKKGIFWHGHEKLATLVSFTAFLKNL